MIGTLASFRQPRRNDAADVPLLVENWTTAHTRIESSVGLEGRKLQEAPVAADLVDFGDRPSRGSGIGASLEVPSRLDQHRSPGIPESEHAFTNAWPV